MGGEQSANKKMAEAEKNEKMIQDILEQQRIMYEKKCKELLKQQKKASLVPAEDAITFHSREVSQNMNAGTHRLTNARLYPNLSEGPVVYGQPSTSRASSTMSGANNNHMYSAMNATVMPPQNKPPSHTAFNCHPTAPTNTNREVPESRSMYNGVQPAAPKASGSQLSVPARNMKLVDWKCITCKNTSNSTKIFQCKEGHSSCMTCKNNGARCGKCKNLITDIRNITLESFIAENDSNMALKTMITVDCPNKDDGCQLKFKPSNIEAHLKECPFRELVCPIMALSYGLCPWRGKINQLQSHFLDCHPHQTGTAAVDTEMTFNYNSAKYVLHLVVMGNFHFLVQLKFESDVMYMVIQLVGTDHSSSKWLYEIHFYIKREPRRKYMYVDVCQPYSDAFTNICKESKCAAVPLQYAKTFFTDDTLTYKFYIKKKIENEPRVSSDGPNQCGGYRSRGRPYSNRN